MLVKQIIDIWLGYLYAYPYNFIKMICDTSTIIHIY